jgi:hypothetical protein
VSLRPALLRCTAVGSLLAASTTPAWLPHAGPEVIVPRSILDSLDAIFVESNRHWDELGDLNTLERMLGTVRPTQREYLGCLQGSRDGDRVRIDGWVPAGGMKQLQLAVSGSCDSVARLVGTFHTHPFHADPQNLPVKERSLSRQDLETFERSDYAVTFVLWDVDSIDAAAHTAAGVRHPVPLVVE